HSAAYCVRIGVEGAPPQAVAEDDRLGTSGPGLFRVELTAQGGTDAQRVEEVGRHRHGFDPLVPRASTEAPVSRPAVAGDSGKTGSVLRAELVLWDAQRGMGALPLDAHQLVWRRVGQRTQQHGVYDAKH